MLGLLLWGYIALISFLVLVSIALGAIAVVVALASRLIHHWIFEHG